MLIKFVGVVFKATPKGEFDKILKIVTPDGQVTATIKGVKRPNAKLKHGAVPFAFCFFEAAKKQDFLTITNAVTALDLSDISADYQKLVAGSIALEAAAYAIKPNSGQDHFVNLLKALKSIIFCKNCDKDPYIGAIVFLQNLIHSGGYFYDYQRYQKIENPLQLLSYLHFNGWAEGEKEEVFEIKPQEKDETGKNQDLMQSVSRSLIIKTLLKIVLSFENKFDCKINSALSLSF